MGWTHSPAVAQVIVPTSWHCSGALLGYWCHRASLAIGQVCEATFNTILSLDLQEFLSCWLRWKALLPLHRRLLAEC